MNKKIILGIETSCDDTSIAVLDNNKVLSCITMNHSCMFDKYGGIVPEIVSRLHEKNILEVYKSALKEAKIESKDIDSIAYTKTPGLSGPLHVGEIFAKSLSFQLNIKCYPINHIHAHAYSPFISEMPPHKSFLSLIVSGKTTSLFLVKKNKFIEIAKTLDDALGEVYDKIGKALGLKYPAGALIDKMFDIKKATITININQQHKVFSYSGIKSYILNLIEKEKVNNQFDVEVIASSFQKWVIDNLVKKLVYFKNENDVELITIGGGVASNSYLRERLNKVFTSTKIPLSTYSCDNAAMIAYLHFVNEYFNNLDCGIQINKNIEN
ncbi:MAG: tRNA (adenosine(37)-N6)-threonylcarbamoyltransferase complex transferase subunit TsaD [Malacoplasma sp.]